VLVLFVLLYLDLRENGDLIAEICRKVQTDVCLLISVMYICWYM
jgi:hypothetical protein